MKSVIYSYYENLILGAVEKIAEEYVASSSSGIIYDFEVSYKVKKELFDKDRIYTEFCVGGYWMSQKAFFDDSLFDLVVKHYGTSWQSRLFSKKTAEEREYYLNELFVQAMYLEKYDERKEIIHNVMRRVSKEN
jgi:hypothetical protein